jgi:hypothetical protein
MKSKFEFLLLKKNFKISKLKRNRRRKLVPNGEFKQATI